MKISRHIHTRLYLKNVLVTLSILLLLSACAGLSVIYSSHIDFSVNAKNSLSDTSKIIVDKLAEPIRFTAYIAEDKPLREKINKILLRYQRYRPDTEIRFVNPAAQPEAIRTLNIPKEGALLISYGKQQQTLSVINESSISNALSGINRQQEHWLTFINGHGERAANGKANYDFATLTSELEKRRIKVVSLKLSDIPAIPDNSSLLVIADPKTEYLDGEMEIVLDYISSGGNLLFLSEPGNNTLFILAMQLGILFSPGTIVDAGSRIYGLQDPSYVVIGKYPQHPISQGFSVLTVFPGAAAIAIDAKSDFTAMPILSSNNQSWNETGAISGTIAYNENSTEKKGPLDFGFALHRQAGNNKQQRIVIIGDSDFVSNTFIGNVGNKALALRMINWLLENDEFIDIPVKQNPDRELLLNRNTIAGLGIFFLVALPALLLVCSFFIKRQRKRL